MLMLFVAQFPPRHVAVGSWLMLHGSMGHNGFGAMKGQITGWSVKYSVSLCAGESQPIVGDINDDGIPEIVFSCVLSSNVYAIRGTTGSILWTSGYGGTWGAPAAADLVPSLPGLEVVVCNSSNTALLRGTDGSTVWVASVGCGSNSGAPAIVIAGSDTLVLVNNGSTLYALRASTGSTVWSASTGGNTLIGIAKSPAVGDIDGDGSYEVVVAGHSTVYAYDARTGTLEWSASVSNRYYTRTPATLVDLTGDCIDEVLVSSDNGNIYALNGADGSTVWVYNISGRMSCGPITTADVNGDSINDVIVGHLSSCNCGTPGGVTVIDGSTGSRIWGHTFTGPNMTHGGGRVVSDFDSDGHLEIAVVPYWSNYMCFGDGVFRMYDAATGTLEWTASNVVGEGSAFADVDGDGCSEIMVLPSAGRATFIVVDNDAVSSCGVYPYNDTCSIVGQGDDLPTEETPKVPYLLTEVKGEIGGIRVSTNTEAEVRIYLPDGRMEARRRVPAGKTFIPSRRGVRIVEVGGRTFTVVVR